MVGAQPEEPTWRTLEPQWPRELRRRRGNVQVESGPDIRVVALAISLVAVACSGPKVMISHVEAPVRTAPARDAERIGSAPPGAHLAALGASGGWTEVTFEGRSGYVSTCAGTVVREKELGVHLQRVEQARLLFDKAAEARGPGCPNCEEKCRGIGSRWGTRNEGIARIKCLRRCARQCEKVKTQKPSPETIAATKRAIGLLLTEYPTTPYPAQALKLRIRLGVAGVLDADPIKDYAQLNAQCPQLLDGSLKAPLARWAESNDRLPEWQAISPSWRSQIRKSLGEGELAVLPAPQGTYVLDPQSNARFRLNDLSAAWAFHDSLADAVWVLADRQDGLYDLFVQDLRTDEPPVAVVEKSPTTIGVAHLWPDGSRRVAYGVTLTRVVVHAKGKPRLKLGPYVRDAFRYKKLKPRKLRLNREPALARLAKRAQASELRPCTSEPTDKPVVSIPDDQFDDPSRRGKSVPVPGTALHRVLWFDMCGDGCTEVWALYDSRTKRYLHPHRPDQPVGAPTYDWPSFTDVWVAASGAAYILDGKVHRFDGSPPVGVGGDANGGWLDGGCYLPFDKRSL